LVTVNQNGDIIVNGDNSYGIFAQSVSGGGGNLGYQVSSPASMAVTYAATLGLGATGLIQEDGEAGRVVINSNGNITINGNNSQAVKAQVIRGGGGNLEMFTEYGTNLTCDAVPDPAAPDVACEADPALSATLSKSVLLGSWGTDGGGFSGFVGSLETMQSDVTGSLSTSGDNSSGSVIQAVGGGGGSAQVGVEVPENVTINESNGTSYTGSSTDITDSTVASTLTARLGAINTNNSGGGDIVSIRTGDVTTVGSTSAGSETQSIGGGGGRLTMTGPAGDGNTSGEVTLGSDPSFDNDAGDITLTLSGDCTTSGVASPCEFAQSIGAGGGTTYMLDLDTAIVNIGAEDNSSGDGGDINLTNNGSAVTTGDKSSGFILQSIGGGGGTTLTDLDPEFVTVNPSSANEGSGGTINFQNTGAIVVSGDYTFGLIAQSLGGGGGIVDGVFRDTAGGVGAGGDITLDQDGNIIATGYNSVGITAQSLGSSGAGDVNIAMSGVLIGGIGPEAYAIDLYGGDQNTINLEAGSFSMGLNKQLMRGGDGSDLLSIAGRAVGNVDLGEGSNTIRVEETGEFIALDIVDLGVGNTLDVHGKLNLRGNEEASQAPARMEGLVGHEWIVPQKREEQG